ncbi:MAG: hypothetical protein ACI9WU_000860 [Myxococcota bacterium]|jgi:hypothetical protein
MDWVVTHGYRYVSVQREELLHSVYAYSPASIALANTLQRTTRLLDDHEASKTLTRSPRTKLDRSRPEAFLARHHFEQVLAEESEQEAPRSDRRLKALLDAGLQLSAAHRRVLRRFRFRSKKRFPLDGQTPKAAATDPTALLYGHLAELQRAERGSPVPPDDALVIASRTLLAGAVAYPVVRELVEGLLRA